jgi:hypothetical protein
MAAPLKSDFCTSGHRVLGGKKRRATCTGIPTGTWSPNVTLFQIYSPCWEPLMKLIKPFVELS